MIAQIFKAKQLVWAIAGSSLQSKAARVLILKSKYFFKALFWFMIKVLDFRS